MTHLRGETRGIPLSPREREVLMSFARTGSRRRTAKRLGIAVSTVAANLRNVYLKTGTHGAMQALRKLGLLDLR